MIHQNSLKSYLVILLSKSPFWDSLIAITIPVVTQKFSFLQIDSLKAKSIEMIFLPLCYSVMFSNAFMNLVPASPNAFFPLTEN